MTWLVAVAAASMLMPAAAHAQGAQDAPGAVLSNTLDQADAASQPQDPNVTCDVTAGGRDLVQHESVVVGELYGEDMGIGEGVCISLDTDRTYSARVIVQLQYYTMTSTGMKWRNISGCYTAGPWTSSTDGVVVIVPVTAVCTYTSTSTYLNHYHRARAVLETSITPSRADYSPVWFMDA